MKTNFLLGGLLAVLFCLIGCAKDIPEGGATMDVQPTAAAVTETPVASPAPDDDMTPSGFVNIVFGDEEDFCSLDLAETDAAKEFFKSVNSDGLELKLTDYDHIEKNARLPFELPAADERIAAQPGDVVLYNGDTLVILYEENTWDYTRIGCIHDSDLDRILKLLRNRKKIKAKFSVEWTE